MQNPVSENGKGAVADTSDALSNMTSKAILDGGGGAVKQNGTNGAGGADAQLELKLRFDRERRERRNLVSRINRQLRHGDRKVCSIYDATRTRHYYLIDTCKHRAVEDLKDLGMRLGVLCVFCGGATRYYRSLDSFACPTGAAGQGAIGSSRSSSISQGRRKSR
jgi:hypothetical protein